MHIPLFIVWASLFALALAGSRKHVLSPSGRKIPVHLIRKHLPDHAHHLLRHALFEHSFERGTVRSSHHHLHIESLAPTVKPIRERAGFSYSLNGRPHPIHKERTIFRQGPKHQFTLVEHNGNMIIAAAWAQGINLRPLHPNLYPDILINTHRPGQVGRARGVELKDYKVVETDLDKAESRYLDDSLNVTARQTCTGDRYYEIAMAYDKSFCANYGDVAAVATAVMQGMVLGANAPYTAATCIRLALIRVDAFCAASATDPYAAPATLSANSILSNFQTAYQAQSTGDRDIAVLVSGYEDGTAVAGFAFEPGSCSITNGYAWVESTNPFVLAHELGHTLSAGHVGTGLMKASIGASDTTFSTASVNTITNFILTSTQATCITSATPVCDGSCPSGTACANGRCVNPPTAAPAGAILCTPITPFFYCTQPLSINPGITEAIACASTFTHVERTADPNDPTILCCNAVTATSDVSLLAAGDTIIANLPDGSTARVVRTGASATSGRIVTASLTACDGAGPNPGPVSPSASPSPGSPTPTSSASPSPVSPSPSPSTGSTVSPTPTPTASPLPSFIVLPGPGSGSSPNPSPLPSVFILPAASPFILPGPGVSTSPIAQPSFIVLPPASNGSPSMTPTPTFFVLPGPASSSPSMTPTPTFFVLPGPVSSSPSMTPTPTFFVLPGPASSSPSMTPTPTFFVLPGPASSSSPTPTGSPSPLFILPAPVIAA